MTTDLINAALFAAIRKAPKLEPGEHPIDLTVHLTGVLRQGEDYESIVNAAVPWERIALIALGKLNANSVGATVREALDEDRPFAFETSVTKPLVQGVVREVKESTRKVCKGKLTGTVHVEEIDLAEFAAAVAADDFAKPGDYA